MTLTYKFDSPTTVFKIKNISIKKNNSLTVLRLFLFILLDFMYDYV